MIKDIHVTNNWFIQGIPLANIFAPWQQPNTVSDTMKPDTTGQVEYRLNNYGYRDEYWIEDDFNDSIWCVGHSDTLGMGVKYEETYCSLLRKHYKTINLGIAGASYDTFSRVICSGLIKYRPKCIILQGTTKERKEYVTKEFQQLILPNFPVDMLPYKDVWRHTDEVTDEYNFERNMQLIKLSTQLHYVPLIMFDFDDRWKLIKENPACDNQHIGAKIHETVSVELLERLRHTLLT